MNSAKTPQSVCGNLSVVGYAADPGQGITAKGFLSRYAACLGQQTRARCSKNQGQNPHDYSESPAIRPCHHRRRHCHRCGGLGRLGPGRPLDRGSEQHHRLQHRYDHTINLVDAAYDGYDGRRRHPCPRSPRRPRPRRLLSHIRSMVTNRAPQIGIPTRTRRRTAPAPRKLPALSRLARYAAIRAGQSPG